MLPPADLLGEAAGGDGIDMEAEFVAHLIDLQVAGITTTVGEPQLDVAANPHDDVWI